MSKSKTLSPKQKKIAAVAGDPNKIEGEDFQKLKTMKASEGRMTEMDLADIVNQNPDAFEAGDRASEKVLQDKVDKDAERFKTIKGAKKAIQKAKTKEKAKQLALEVGKAASPIAIGATQMKYFMGNAFKGDSDRMTTRDLRESGMSDKEISAGLSASSMKRGGSVMARGCKLGRNKKTKIY